MFENCATRSDGVMVCDARTQSMKWFSALRGIITPLGWPVVPEVKMT